MAAPRKFKDGKKISVIDTQFFVHWIDIFTFSSKFWNLVILSNNLASIYRRSGGSLTKRGKVAYKPLKTVNSLFPRPKTQTDVDRPKSVTVFKISYTNCNFVHCGQTGRPLKTRIAEHKRAVAMFDHDSEISCHVYEHKHQMNFHAVNWVVSHEPNFHERLFLEAWLSIKHPRSGNEQIAIPEIYKSLARAWVSRHVFWNFARNVFPARAFNALPLFQITCKALSFKLMKA